MLPEGVKIQPEPPGQFSGGADSGPLAFESFLSGYYAESIRIIYEAHLTDCTARHGDLCATCEAVRAGLTGIRAEQRATAPKAAS